MKILFTSSQHASFITQDFNLLRKHFTVDQLMTRGVLAPLAIFFHLFKADVTYTWLANVYSFFVVWFARILKKRSFLVIGGADVARVPEMNYGIWLSPWRRPLVRYALRNATTVLAVDGSLEKRAVDLARYPGGNITCLPTGYDGAVWVPSGTKERRVLTVAKCTDVLKMRIKGVDVIFDCARSMPDVPFTVIGLAPKLLRDAKAQAPANAEIIPLVEQRELLEHYQRAKVYCQPSYIEGLPNSLCEAMLCECVPVGTDVAGIPTVMDGLGFLVKYGDVQGLAGAIRKALDEPASTGERARARISENFSLQKRESALVSLIAEGAE